MYRVSESLDSSSADCAVLFLFCFHQIEVSSSFFYEFDDDCMWKHRNNNRTHQYSRNSKMPLRPTCMFHRTFREYSEAGLTCIGIIGFIINRLCIFFFYQIEVSEFKFFVYVFDGCGNIGIIIRLISIPEIQKCHCDRPACSIARLESTVRQDSWQQ